VGLITRYAKDAAIVLNAIAGKDESDPSTLSQHPCTLDPESEKSLLGLRIGVPRSYFYEPLERDVRAAVESALEILKRGGASIAEVNIPSLFEALPAIWAIVLPEATFYHQMHLKTHPEKYSDRVRSDLEKGTSVPAIEYLRAQELRKLMSLEFQEAFSSADIIATPTLPIPAPRFEQELAIYGNEHEDIRTALNRLGCPFNLTGLPAITIPCGLSKKDLPIGLQLVGPPFGEKIILQVAHAYQKETVWNIIHPPNYV
jgi:aspartyl-tRNA(Asn)/glutamyl-tRNA(Gln) amidotransferase subunit A